MTAPDAAAWADALTMYERRYSVVAVGPRTHEDWSLDVLALLRKEVSDPRSWRSLEFYAEGDEEWRADWLAPFAEPDPFAEPGPGRRSTLLRIPRASAARLLVALSTNWLDVTSEPDFEARRPDLEAKADVLLSRFPEPATEFYANAGYDMGDAPDFYLPLIGWDPFSEHERDIGLIAVSDTEVGVFWSFDAT
ncbi:hypothetical protein ACFYWX_06300 [Streptomyces sp. NPDC002888]|uniref:hypothetical protein n=1 Tax=Streptomyces sp. NPDC002888 TaxID=3364668 RepID=UPI0036C371A0